MKNLFKMIQCMPMSRWLLSPALITLFALVNPARSQTTKPSESEIHFEVSLLSVLQTANESSKSSSNGDSILPKSIKGPVWEFTAQPGRRLVQIPIIIKPGEIPFELNSSFIKLKGGKFLAFRLNDKGGLDALKKKSKSRRRRGNDPLESELEAKPIMAKKVVVRPDGTIAWKLDTRIKSASPHGDSLFTYKIDRKKLTLERPPSPKRERNLGLSRKEKREKAIAFRTGMQLYRAKQKEWLNLQKKVNRLPKKLESKLPTRIWIIYDISAFQENLQLSGNAPLPWSISLKKIEALQEMAKTAIEVEKGSDGKNQISRESMSQIIELSVLANDKHPYNQRLVAYVLSLSKAVEHATFGDPLFYLLQTLLKGEDAETRNIVMEELASGVKPTRATRELLKLVAGQQVTNDHDKITAFRSLVTGNQDMDSSTARDMIATANAMLADKEGPLPAQIIQLLLQAAHENEEIGEIFLEGIQFRSLPETRLNDALVFIVENAGAEELAAAWLDQQFISAVDTRMLIKALEVIANADTGARDLGPAVNWGIELLFGPPQAADGGQAARKARMRLPIMINTPRHGIFRALQHGDRHIRQLAWRALPRFIMPLQQDEISDLDTGRYGVLLNAAMDQIPTPLEVVDFLIKQPDHLKMGQGLIQVALRGTRRTSAAAIRALVGSAAPLDRIMLNLEAGERQGFAMLVYQVVARQVPAPMVTNVLRRREPNSPVAAWFGNQIAKGTLPKSADWFEQFEGGVNQLLALAMSNDPELAKGASAVLVASVGGNDRTAIDFLSKIQILPDQTSETVQKAWEEQRSAIFAAQLQHYEGSYQLVFRVFDPKQNIVTEDNSTDTPKPNIEIVLGMVQFLVNREDSTLSLGNPILTISIPEHHNMITVDNPADIKQFPNPELADLPLAKVTEKLNMTRDVDGIWKGKVILEGGSRAELLMKPVVEKTKTKE